MSKQVSLNNFMIVASDVETAKETNDEKTCSERLTPVIVKLDPAFGRCSICNRWAMLRFCLESFNNEGDMVRWGEICEDCRLEWEKRSGGNVGHEEGIEDG